MKRRILLVDDEVAILLTLKAILEISGFDVDTATSARDGKHKLHHGEYHMVITDMRMESEAAGVEVIQAARVAPYGPAIALLTSFPPAEEDWLEMGADRMLVKPMHTRLLLDEIERLLQAREARLAQDAENVALLETVAEAVNPASGAKKPPTRASKPTAVKKAAPKKGAAKRVSKKAPAKKAVAKKTAKKVAAKAKKKTATKRVGPVSKKRVARKISAKKVAAKKPRGKKKAARRRR